MHISWTFACTYGPTVGVFVVMSMVVRASLLGERRTRDRKVVISNPGRSGGKIVFSRVYVVC